MMEYIKRQFLMEEGLDDENILINSRDFSENSKFDSLIKKRIA